MPGFSGRSKKFMNKHIFHPLYENEHKISEKNAEQ